MYIAPQPAAAQVGVPAEWWRGAVIYQVYPRSFQDSNADGIGDLPGVTRRLDYLAGLGVDAIWLSPFFTSPMKDFGYDISDYRDVAPIFGTLADFDALVARAHALGLKVLIDQVMSHCSDQHPWFAASRAAREGAFADWFVWADPKRDGSPPNNWLSVFGGSAWQWDARRRQYYLHNFLASQPDLNFHHPAVQEAALDNLRFWLERGVDGFRLDVSNFCFHDAALRDNPPRLARRYDPAVNDATPYALQQHVYDKSRPENLLFLQRVRRLLDAYPGTCSLGEIGDDDSLARMAEYTGGGDKLHMAYSFDLLGPRCDARYLHSVLERFHAQVAGGWASWSLSNHDVVRVASRWRPSGAQALAPDDALRPAWLRLILALLLSLRGSPCLYQGEELGLTEVTLPREQLQDPYGIAMWPEFQGRDGCRTPMAWERAALHGGFSESPQCWLPVAGEHLSLAAMDQVRDPASLHAATQELLAWRRRFEVLRTGAITLLDAHDTVLAFVRWPDQRAAPAMPLLCAFNLSATPTRFALSGLRTPGWRLAGDATLTPGCLVPGRIAGDDLHLPPCGGCYAELAALPAQGGTPVLAPASAAGN